jgi:hypothetical protein
VAHTLDWRRRASTSVVLPWSTCAMIAIFRTSSRDTRLLDAARAGAGGGRRVEEAVRESQEVVGGPRNLRPDGTRRECGLFPHKAGTSRTFSDGGTSHGDARPTRPGRLPA